jgi:hypothetical protein
MQPTRIVSVELHAKLGATIDRTLIDPLIVTKHGRNHLVMLSAERYPPLVATPEAGRTRKAAPPAPKLARTR